MSGLQQALRTKTVLTQYANDLDAASRIANRVPLVSKLQKHDPDIRLPSNKDHRVVPVRECLRRANKEVLMAEKRLMREYERIQAQEKQIEQEITWLTKQLASTQAFLERVAPATKMREKFLAPEKGSRAIVRDLLQKQLLIQKAELEKSCQLYRDELIGLDTSAKHLKGVSSKLRHEVQAKDASLVTDAAASHARHSEKYAGLPPYQDGRPLLLPRCTWLQHTNEVMADAGFVFQNSTRVQVHSSSLRRTRGVVDENFRLKIVEMIQRMLGKSDLARPFLEQRLEDLQGD